MTPIKLKIKNNISYLEGTKTKWDNVYGDSFTALAMSTF